MYIGSDIDSIVTASKNKPSTPLGFPIIVLFIFDFFEKKILTSMLSNILYCDCLECIIMI